MSPPTFRQDRIITMHVTFPLLLAFQMPGFGEMLLIAGLGLLIFGKRLPEVGKSLGKGIVEFKKGLKGIEDDVEVASSQQQSMPAPASRQQIAQQPYKFDPHTGKPVEQPQQSPPSA
jgi:sec-independent protein translocase protein TatA